MGLWYEELEPGRELVSGTRRLTAEDVRAFAALSGDANPIHLDPAAARAAGFEGPIAHGALGVAVATGLLSALGLTRGSLIALVALRWRFAAPVRAGDELRLRVRVADKREATRPDRGLVTFAVSLLNQRGEVVQEGELEELVRRRAGAAESGG